MRVLFAIAAAAMAHPNKAPHHWNDRELADWATPVAGGIGAPSAVTRLVQTPLYARARSIYACTTARHDVWPEAIAAWMLAIVASSI